MGTIVETLKQEALLTGEARGLAKGKAEGIAEGLVVGLADTLTRLLKRRFGPLPRKLRDRIAAAELNEIEAWLDAILDAPDLEAVFATDTPH